MLDKFKQIVGDIVGRPRSMELEDEDELINVNNMNRDNDNRPQDHRVASDPRMNNDSFHQRPLASYQRDEYGRPVYSGQGVQGDGYSEIKSPVYGGQVREHRQDGYNGYPNSSASEHRNLERILRQMSELSEKIDMLSMNVQGIGSVVKDSSASARAIQNEMNQLNQIRSVISSQDSTIRSQHNASVKFNEDVLYKTQKSLIMELIGIADEIRMILDNKREDESYDLLGALHDLEESVEASLSNNSVRRFRESECDDISLNRRRQAVVGRETTNDSSLDSHYKSISPGYEWTMPYVVISSEAKLDKFEEENRTPKMFSFVIRPEEVVKLSYKAENAKSSEIGGIAEEDANESED